MTFIIGCCFGSFGYLLITRHMAGISSAWPPSHCTACKSKLTWYELIPLFSFLIQAGRCRHCHVKFSSAYFWAELSCGLLFMLCIPNNFPTIATYLLLFWLYSAWLLSIVDIYTQTLDSKIFFWTTLLLWCAQFSLHSVFHWETLLYCGFFVCFFLRYYQNKMGAGDLYLLLAWSPWLSFYQFCLLLLISSSLGLLYFLGAKIVKKHTDTLPFIPFLSGGLFVVSCVLKNS